MPTGRGGQFAAGNTGRPASAHFSRRRSATGAFIGKKKRHCARVHAGSAGAGDCSGPNDGDFGACGDAFVPQQCETCTEGKEDRKREANAAKQRQEEESVFHIPQPASRAPAEGINDAREAVASLTQPIAARTVRPTSRAPIERLPIAVRTAGPASHSPVERFDVVVVGGGGAGLAAAHALVARGLDPSRIVLLEGRDRIGGRVHTLALGAESVADAAAAVRSVSRRPSGAARVSRRCCTGAARSSAAAKRATHVDTGAQVCFYLPLHFKRILLTILTCPPHILTFKNRSTSTKQTRLMRCGAWRVKTTVRRRIKK